MKVIARVCGIVVAMSGWVSSGWADDIPTYRDVLGRDIGDRITQHHEMVQYLEALARTSNRVRLMDQGASWEGRRLLAAIVSARSNLDRLDEIEEKAARLAEPRLGNTPIEGQPIVLWMGGAIHGPELSGCEGLLRVLERLTTQSDPRILQILENAVIIIDPILNPDGRDACAQMNHRRLGVHHEASRDDWNNDFNSWEALQFRTCHYYFDLNRDWFAHVHPETRARVQTLQRFHPQVVIDAHEMGADVEFYFDPPAPPMGTHFPQYAKDGFELFGRAYARAFDREGFEYMTRERFNYFYPGYTTSYTSYLGAVGMLYEQGSTRGLSITRADGSIRTLKDSSRQQYVAAWAAIETSVDERESLLTSFVSAKEHAIKEGEGAGYFLILPRGDEGHRREFVDVLKRNGIEVHVLTKSTRFEKVFDRRGVEVEARLFPPSTLVVDGAQPRSPLIRTLLDGHNPVPEDFLREAKERVERGESARFYDITAWSLGFLFDLEVFRVEDRTPLVGKPHENVGPRLPEGRAAYAYIFDGGNASCVPVMKELLDEGRRLAMTLKAITIEGTTYPSGSLVIRVGQNGDDIHDRVKRAAKDHRVSLFGVDTGLGDPSSPSLGSGDVLPLVPPRIGLLAEGGIHGYSFGWAWHALDVTYGLDPIVLRLPSLRTKKLNDWNVLVMPSLRSADETERGLGDEGKERLVRWVREGGTLVVLGSSVELARKDLELLSLRSAYDTEEDEDQERQRRYSVPGAFFSGRVDGHGWLGAGLGETVPMLINSSRVYHMPEGPIQTNRRAAITNTGELLSGHAWEESLRNVAESVLVYEERVGRGKVIAFVEDPNFRGYWRGIDRMFLNAVTVGPSRR